MKTLIHNQHVRLSTWAYPYDDATAKVGTLYGFAADANTDYEALRTRTIASGHDVAWTTYTGSALLGDRREAQMQAQRQKAHAAKAAVLEDGELVQIMGDVFSVHVNAGNHKGPRNSDPIKFIPRYLVGA